MDKDEMMNAQEQEEESERASGLERMLSPPYHSYVFITTTDALGAGVLILIY
jgi:hypothetical protein